MLVICGCDKNMPGEMMALARLNIPGIYVYGGTVKPVPDDHRSHPRRGVGCRTGATTRSKTSTARSTGRCTPAATSPS